MLVLVGKTGSGKTTIANDLVKNWGYKKVVTYTTRKPRKNEKNGVDYHFVTLDEFEEMESNDFFAETTSYVKEDEGLVKYGTSKESLKDKTLERVVILNPDGLKSVKGLTSIYLKCNNDTLRARATKRGDNPGEIERRLEADDSDFEDIYDYVDVTLPNDKGLKVAETTCFVRDLYETIEERRKR